MCLVAVAWRAHPRYPLILAANRDEFHDRPSAPAAWWSDAPQVLGGRDLVAGGTWLAVSRSGRVGVVINDPRRPPGPGHTGSRGHLVRDFVAGERPSGRYLDAVAVADGRYAGYCLVVGTPVQLRAFASADNGSPRRWTLAAGVSVFSNSPPETPWPKVGFLESALRDSLAGPDVDREALFGLLARREPVATMEVAAHPASLTPFIVGQRYGTRASSLLLISVNGQCHFEERRFAAGGAPDGHTTENFALAS